jgi:hypothetical protein
MAIPTPEASACFVFLEERPCSSGMCRSEGLEVSKIYQKAWC